jgi:outer membrane protein TolC
VELAVEGGTAYRSDLDEIQVEILNADQKLTELVFNREAFITVLELMVGEPINRSETFIKPALVESTDGWVLSRPELRLFDYQRQFFEAQSGIYRSKLYPKVGLTGFGVFIQPGVAFGASDLNRILVGGLSLSWNIGGLYTNANDKNLTRLNLEKVDNQEEVFRFNTSLELTQSTREMEKYRELMKRDQEIVRLKSKIKGSYETKYENGISTMSELLDRTNEENVSRQTLLLHEVQYLMAAYKYKTTSGN